MKKVTGQCEGNNMNKSLNCCGLSNARKAGGREPALSVKSGGRSGGEPGENPPSCKKHFLKKSQKWHFPCAGAVFREPVIFQPPDLDSHENPSPKAVKMIQIRGSGRDFRQIPHKMLTVNDLDSKRISLKANSVKANQSRSN